MSSFPDRLDFTYTEDELITYSRIRSMRQDRGPSYSNFRAAMVVIIFGLGFTVLLAKYLGWVEPSEFRTVLFTAYASFFAGTFAYHGALRLGYRRVTRAWHRSGGEAYGPYEVTFEANGVVYKAAKIETRVPWDAIAEVRETRSLVLIWISRAQRGLPIPARMFSNAAARAAFTAAIREHSAQARANSSSGSGES
jgi:hypothetical protein